MSGTIQGSLRVHLQIPVELPFGHDVVMREAVLEGEGEEVRFEVGGQVGRTTRQGRVRRDLSGDGRASEGEGADGIDSCGGVEEGGGVGENGAIRRRRTLQIEE